MTTTGHHRHALARDVRGGTDSIQLLILVASAFVVIAGAIQLGDSVLAKFGREAQAVDELAGWDHATPAAGGGGAPAAGARTPGGGAVGDGASGVVEPGAAPRAGAGALSPIGERIVARLRDEHADRQGVTWGVTTGNQLQGDWIIDSPTTWTRQAPGANDFLFDEMYDAFTTADRSIVFATLAPPDGPYVQTINRALRDLEARQPPGGEGIDVRVIIGREEAEPLRRQLTEGLDPDGPVRVSVGVYSDMGAFSHTKIIATDGDHALVGGHNWWAKEYNVEHPVHDVSLRIDGPAAGTAEDHFDGLWAHVEASGAAVGNARRPPRARAPAPAAPGSGAPAGVPIIGVGTQGGVSVTADATSDAAIYAMIDSAQRSVKISQQDLVSMDIAITRDHLAEILPVPRRALDWFTPAEIRPRDQHLTPGLLDALGDALYRGVAVDIAISTSADGDHGGYSNGWSTEQVRQAIEDHVRDMARPPWWKPWQDPLPADRVRAALDGLTVRGVHTEAGETTRNHAKVVIVDDQTFYVGSQNLYPGGMAETAWMQLAEFGFIVDDAQRAREFVEVYWGPLWRNTRPTVIPPTPTPTPH